MGKTPHYRPAPPDLFVFNEAARRLRMSPRTLERRLREDEHFPRPRLIGNTRVYTAGEIDALALRMTNDSSP